MSASEVRRFINSLPDKRASLQLLYALDQLIPTNKDAALTAYAGGGQANALVLKKDCAFHDVTTVATAADSVVLPNPKAGDMHFVKNSAALSMQVFAVDPGTIDSTATGTGVAQLAGDGVLYLCVVDGNYIRLGGVSATEVFGSITADNLTMANPIIYDNNTTITAFATGGQTSATALTGEFNNVTTCATAGDSVKLLAAAAGLKVTVKNSGAASLAVFPDTSDSINALAVDLSVNIPVGGELTFRAKDATVWETNEAMVLPAPTTQSGELVIKAADNAADHEIVVVNASHGQATTHTIPDPGGAAASFVLTEGTQTVNGAKTFSNLSSVTVPAASAEHGAGAIGTSSFGAPQTRRWTENGVIVTQTKFDLTGLASGGTANDVVGLAAGGAAYIGRNVVATNGVIFKMELSCLETPVTGDGDIDIVADTSAALIGDGAYTGAIKINGGTLVIGQTVQNLVPAVDANFYFYIAAVGAGGGTYTAGMFVLTTYGHAVLA